MLWSSMYVDTSKNYTHLYVCMYVCMSHVRWIDCFFCCVWLDMTWHDNQFNSWRGRTDMRWMIMHNDDTTMKHFIHTNSKKNDNDDGDDDDQFLFWWILIKNWLMLYQYYSSDFPNNIIVGQTNYELNWLDLQDGLMLFVVDDNMALTWRRLIASGKAATTTGAAGRTVPTFWLLMITYCNVSETCTEFTRLPLVLPCWYNLSVVRTFRNQRQAWDTHSKFCSKSVAEDGSLIPVFLVTAE